MPKNNNQKGPSAAARLAKLPLVGSACTKLSVLYIGTKCSHPALKSVCEGLESGVTAILSPVIVKLEPQISIANNLACRSLDWLESMFPVVHTPAEQVLAAAKNKMNELQELVSIAANGSLDCVHIVVTWLSGRMQQAEDQVDQPLVERAITVASMGLDSALVMSESLVDQVLPPTKEDKEEESKKKLEGFEVTTPSRSYPVRLVALVAKTYRRMCHMVTDNLTISSGLVQELQTSWQSLVWSVQMLPQNVQHQLVSAFFFLTQMYNLSCPPTQNQQSVKEKSFPNVPMITTDKAFNVPPPPTCRQRKPIKSPIFDNGCNVKGRVGP